jgi:hypothetical protein
VGFDRAHADLKNLMHRIDRQLLGSNFTKFPAAARTEAYFVFEGHRRHHCHVHALWRAPKGHENSIDNMFPGEHGGIWNDVIPSGSYAVAKLPEGQSVHEFSGYIMKTIHRFSEADLIVWASEFHRAR